MFNLEAGKRYRGDIGNIYGPLTLKNGKYCDSLGWKWAAHGTGINTQENLVEEYTGILLEEGKRYRNKAGQFYGPMIRAADGNYRTEADIYRWSEDGKHLGSNGKDNAILSEDLVVGKVEDANPYATLREALDAAYAQTATGKGHRRHSDGKAWLEQPIFKIAQEEGPAFLSGQAKKKIGEATGMYRRGEVQPARDEVLGAICYLAALWTLWGQE